MFSSLGLSLNVIGRELVRHNSQCLFSFTPLPGAGACGGAPDADGLVHGARHDRPRLRPGIYWSPHHVADNGHGRCCSSPHRM